MSTKLLDVEARLHEKIDINENNVLKVEQQLGKIKENTEKFLGDMEKRSSLLTRFFQKEIVEKGNLIKYELNSYVENRDF